MRDVMFVGHLGLPYYFDIHSVEDYIKRGEKKRRKYGKEMKR